MADVASQPARQRSARLNQRSFCPLARLTDIRPRPGRATFSTPKSSASRSFCGENSAVPVAISGACPEQARWCSMAGIQDAASAGLPLEFGNR